MVYFLATFQLNIWIIPCCHHEYCMFCPTYPPCVDHINKHFVKNTNYEVTELCMLGERDAAPNLKPNK